MFLKWNPRPLFSQIDEFPYFQTSNTLFVELKELLNIIVKLSKQHDVKSVQTTMQSIQRAHSTAKMDRGYVGRRRLRVRRSRKNLHSDQGETRNQPQTSMLPLVIPESSYQRLKLYLEIISLYRIQAIFLTKL